MGTAPDGTKQGYMQTKGSTIQATIARIESNTCWKAKKAKKSWEELYPRTAIACFFVAKCDVSEIPLDELHAALPAFKWYLLSNGFGIYSIDYTQDFSGVLDLKVLVHFLQEYGGFREKGGFAGALEE